MKPQALQDAIKAAASKKRNNVDSGGWKEPEVKGHKMTADEFQSLRTKRPQAPPAISSPSYPSSLHSNMGSPGGSGGVAEIVRKMEMELQEFQREKKALIDEMRSHRQRMSDSTDSVESLRREVDKLSSMVERLEGENKKLRDKVRYSSLNGSQSNLSVNPDNADLEKMERRVEQLEKENRLFRDKMKGAGINEIETLRSKIEKLEEERTREPGKTVIPTSRSKGLTPTSPDVPRTTVAPPRSPVASKAACIAPRSPASPSKPKTKPKAPTTPTSSPRLVTASDSTSSSNGAPYLKPHTAEKISKYQARDEALKAYLANPSAPIGMYPRKTMSVETIDGKSLVFFRNKVYVPDKLREKHMEWYIEHYKENAKEKLLEQSTWPNQEREMFEFVRNHS